MEGFAPWVLLIVLAVGAQPVASNGQTALLDGQHARSAFHTAMNWNNTEAQRAILNSWVVEVLARVPPPATETLYSKHGLVSYLQDSMMKEIADMDNYTAADILANAGSMDYQCERIRQNTPMNVVDGMWANMFVPDTVPRPYVLIVDKIRFEEQGEGDLKKNHPYMWMRTAASVGFVFPPVASPDFAYSLSFQDQSFWNGALTAAVCRLQTWIPELLGMIAFLEMRSSAPCHRQILHMKHHGLDFSYYQVHRSIDNPHTGHGAQILEAINDYMSGAESPEEEKEMALRVYKGDHAFEFTIDAIDEAVEQHLPMGGGCPGEQSGQYETSCRTDSGRHRSSDHHSSVVAYSTAQITAIDQAMEQFIAKHSFAYAFHRGPEKEHLRTPGDMISYLRQRCDLFLAESVHDAAFLRLFNFGGPMYGVGTADDRALLRDFAMMNRYLCSAGGKE